MKPYLNQGTYLRLTKVLMEVFNEIEIVDQKIITELNNYELLELFLSAKKN